ncbi:heterokaryon incompatibility protein-domain-containing protein [Xylaria flabelliformis]|nr:heterokaryon incompatibility protein-domain-containing protein [Xylaria flabelliformis]
MPSYTSDPALHTDSVSIDIVELERMRDVESLPFSAPSKAQFYNSLPVSASDRTIRILEIESSSGSPAAGFQLAGRLRVISLKDSPQISALSYVWGPLSEPDPDVLRIRLANDRHIDLNITANCASALRDLTSIFGSLSIWVDAISINQDDDAEKASQILLMEEIYTWAKVYVWLGPRSDASARTFQRYRSLKTKHWLNMVALASAADMGQAKRRLLHDVIQKRIKYPSFPSSPDTPLIVTMIMLISRTLIWPSTEVLFAIVICPLLALYKLSRYVLACARSKSVSTPHTANVLSSGDPHGYLHEIDDVLSRPWFHRGWTFQEILFPMDIVVVCGTDFLSWDSLVRGIQYDINDDISDISERSTSVANFLGLLGIWVNIPRQTSWNEKPIRMTIDDQNPTIGDYHSRSLQLLGSLTWTVILLIINTNEYYRYLFPFTLFFPSFSYLPFIIIFLTGYITAPVCAIASALVSFTVRLLILFPARKRILEEHFDTTPKYTKPVHGVVNALRTRQTSDPKDRTFANYAILASLGAKPREPDYKKELGLIYQECFVSLLQWEPGILNLITEIGVTPLRGSASWVPHWHAAASTAWIGVPKINDTAADKILAEVSFDQSTCLVVSGQLIGRIQHCSGPSTSMEINDKAMVSLFSMDWSQWEEPTKEKFLVSSLKLADWIHFIRHIATYMDPIPFIVKHVLYLQYTYDLKHFVPSSPIDLASNLGQGETALEIWYSRMVRVPASALESAKSRGPHSLLNTEFHRNILPPQEEDTNDYPIVREQVLMISKLLAGQRSLFVTDNGYVGCGTETMQYNDHIFWVSGVSVPMILRPRSVANVETGYTVVGPAFVHKPPDRSGTKQRIHLY